MFNDTQEFPIPKNLGERVFLAITGMYLSCVFGNPEVWKCLWLKVQCLNGLPLIAYF